VDIKLSQKGTWKRSECLFCESITPVPCPFSVLAVALFIYYTSVPTGTEARIGVK